MGGQEIWSPPAAGVTGGSWDKEKPKKGTCSSWAGPKVESAPRVAPGTQHHPWVCTGQMFIGGADLFTTRRPLRSKSKKEIKTVMVKHSYLFSLINSLQFLIEKKTN